MRRFIYIEKGQIIIALKEDKVAILNSFCNKLTIREKIVSPWHKARIILPMSPGKRIAPMIAECHNEELIPHQRGNDCLWEIPEEYETKIITV